MSKWQSVVQCNKCKKIYPNGTPNICEKCGEKIAEPDPFSSILLGENRVSLVNSQRVVAKRKFFQMGCERRCREMTPQEALKVIDKVHDYPCPYGIGGTAWMYIRNCIEKQIPKKPIVEDSKDYEGYIFDIAYRCPKCNRVVCFDGENDIEEAYPYCNCGQALDWSADYE